MLRVLGIRRGRTRTPGGPGGPGAGADDLLLESGDHLLLEDGSALLLE